MLFLLIFFLFKPDEYSFTGIYFLGQNSLDYQGAVIRESEFEIFNPFYFYLKEFQFFKTENIKIIPYQIKFEWDIGFKRKNKNSILKVVYNHVCNHGIDHPGIDRRQWNQFAIKLILLNRHFFFQNSAGYVVSPFGPKRKNNNYNWIFFHKVGFEKKFKHFCLMFDVGLEGFMDITSLRYSSAFKIIIASGRFFMGSGFERHYSLQGVNTGAVSFYHLFTGIMERIPEFEVSYGYFFKNPDYSFFSDFTTEYKIFKTIGILTHLKTVSPLKTQQPRFYDYKIGFNADLKSTNFQLYHRERRDGNLFDGKSEEINSISLNNKILFKDILLHFLLDYAIKVKDYPFRITAGLEIQKEIYEWKNIPLKIIFNTELYYLSGKSERGFIFEAGPSFSIKKKKDIRLCFRQKIASNETLEHYGIFEQRFFISMRFENKKENQTGN